MGGRWIGSIAAALLALAGAPPASADRWVAGDGHVHTCYSHDAWCGPGVDDDPFEPKPSDPADSEYPAFYSFGGTVAERFAEGKAKGMDFLVISDHDRIDAFGDPGWGTAGVTGVHAYETSIRGHAQMIGAPRQYDRGTQDAAAIAAMADALRKDGGVFQVNHPGYRLGKLPQTCADVVDPSFEMHWRYGFQVLPDTVEVWNATTLLRPSETYWECWLQRGARLGALGGSDSHGANHVNIGFPMTWAFAKSTSERDVLAALRAGRTTLSRVAPNQGAVRLLLEGDRNRDGRYESMIGDEVPPGTPLQVRAENLPGPGLLRIRANGTTAQPDGRPLAPNGVVKLSAPAQPGWVRATLYLRDGTAAVDPGCGPTPFDSPVSTCTEDLAVAAMTSPIWVGLPAAEPKVDPPGPPPERAAGPEPDSQAPVPPGQEGAGPPPDVPPQRDRPPPVSKLRATWFRAAAARHRSLRVRLRWKASEGPFDVQIRRPGAKAWKPIASQTQKRQRIVRLARGTWKLRVRAVPPLAPAGPWRRLTIRL
ncbi:MAG TPA: CehA/McbA family metallohydrolase [Thermoleophilaceae bacterium]|jgi:hypothetical protein